MDEKIKIGVAGLGRSGWGIHCGILEKLKDCYELVAVCDEIEERIKEAKDKFNCKTYEKFEDLINDRDVEVVVISTPSFLHCPHTIKALEKGKNVVCEKPMATSLKEADEMIKKAKNTGKILTVFQNRRYEPAFLKIKELIESGIIGEIVLIKLYYQSFSRRWDWQTLKKFGGGSLNNTGVHIIDQVLHFIKEDIEDIEIFCDLKRTITLGDADDHDKILLKGKKSPTIDIEITSVCAYPTSDNWIVMGTKGGIKANFNTVWWKYYKEEELPKRTLQTEPTPDRSYNRDEIKWYEEKWEVPEEEKDFSFKFYIDFYKTIKENKPLSITPESVRRTMYVIEKCHKISGI